MLGGIENLKNYRVAVVKFQPDHPDLAKLDALIAHGELLMTQQIPEKARPPKVDLRKQTYDLLHHVVEPTEEEKKALEAKGIVFVPVASKTYAQVVAEDEGYFWDNELNYANSHKALKEYAMPVAVSVGVRPGEQLAIPNSARQSRNKQLQVIEAYSHELQTEFSDFRAVMFPSTGYAQADRAYKQLTGEVLFRNYFAGALDNISGVGAASAGRLDPSDQFFVCGWYEGLGRGLVRAVPAVVKIGVK